MSRKKAIKSIADAIAGFEGKSRTECENIMLGEKYKKFMERTTAAEFLEGTTASGKTVAAGYKFVKACIASPKKLHVLASKTTGTAEKNIINSDYGIKRFFPSLRYNGNGDRDNKLPHIKISGKIIYVLGYDNRDKWENVLGSQFGCVYIDEINTADINFVREISTRCHYLLATLNPDNPDLPVYKEFINSARPLPEYACDVPTEIMAELTSEAKPGWDYWFFNMDDNTSLSAEDKKRKILSAPKGTKLYKNKILGLRGKATGIVFSNFDRAVHVITEDTAKRFLRNGDSRVQTEWFIKFTSGLDTSYSQKSPDTIAMTFAGITNRGRYVQLEECTYNNAVLRQPIAPSDTVTRYIDFLERCRKAWGLARDVYIDSADAATITELRKYKRQHGCVYIFNPAWKKTQIIDRINLQLGWMSHDSDARIVPYYYVSEKCPECIRELELYSWDESKDNTPEDKNDHTINSSQYSWLPYKDKIGGKPI